MFNPMNFFFFYQLPKDLWDWILSGITNVGEVPF